MTRNNGSPTAALSLLSFRPSVAVQAELRNRDIQMSVHQIEAAAGPVNLDNYQVEVSVAPKWLGQPVEPATLLGFIRKNLNEFMETGTCKFYPYAGIDKAKWQSASPVGALLHIDMYSSGFNVESGAVVCAESEPDRWIFSTVNTPRDFTHPVSGSREFGFYLRGDKVVVYTMACDRVTGFAGIDVLGDTVFAGGHRTWLGFQRKLVAYIKRHGGEAKLLASHSSRYGWEDLKRRYFHPKTAWIGPVPVMAKPMWGVR